MTSQRQLLLVVPKPPFELDDQILIPLIFEALGHKDIPPEAVKGNLMKIVDMLSLGSRTGEYIYKKLVGNRFGVMEIARNIDMLKELAKGLLNRFHGVDQIFPSLRILAEHDDLLKLLAASDKEFQTGVVYAGHPADQKFFIRLSDYHQYLLNDKRAEFLKIAASLGCHKITLTENEGVQKKGGVKAGVEGVEEIGDISASVNARSSENRGFKLSAEFEKPEGDKLPYIPEDLRWLNLEPLWQSMVTSRLENWVSSFQVEFSYDTDFGVNASLAALVEKIGLKIGGSFHEQKNIRQTYQVDFFPRSCYDALLNANK